MDNKELQSTFQVTQVVAEIALRLMSGTCEVREDDPIFPHTSRWAYRECHNLPAQHEITMHALNELLGCHGVEAIKDPRDSSVAVAEYLNAGETYAPTIIRDCESGKYMLCGYGDWLEEFEQEICVADHLVQCGYCSHFTPNDRVDWRDVRCGQCGRNVQTGEECPERKPHTFARIKLLHGYLERALFHRKPGISYARAMKAMELMAGLVHDYDSDSESLWYIGESGSADMANMLAGSYWFFVHYHSGQWSEEYRTQCAIGAVFSPGMSGLDKDNSSEYDTYKAWVSLSYPSRRKSAKRSK